MDDMFGGEVIVSAGASGEVTSVLQLAIEVVPYSDSNASKPR